MDSPLVGSYASNIWGRPRSSYDADIVARVTIADAERFHEAFAGEYALDLDALRADLRRGAMFNLIPFQGIFKVDIIPIRQTAYAREEFARRRSVQALGCALWVASPEDTVLFKLVWYRKGDEVSGRQLEDARDVCATQRELLDDAYLDRWADELGVRDLLDRVRERH